MPADSIMSCLPIPRCLVRRPLQFAWHAKEKQYRAEMNHVQQFIRAQVGGLDEDSSQLLGVHDCRSRCNYDEIQTFLERKQLVEHQQYYHETTQQTTEHVLIRGLDEYLHDLDPSLFEFAPAMPKCLVVANLPAQNSYIRQKQEEATIARLWVKCQTAGSVLPLTPNGRPLKRLRAT